MLNVVGGIVGVVVLFGGGLSPGGPKSAATRVLTR
jgi:delta 1-pyrroline-5-carboxylate dehydrogenase